MPTIEGSPQEELERYLAEKIHEEGEQRLHQFLGDGYSSTLLDPNVAEALEPDVDPSLTGTAESFFHKIYHRRPRDHGAGPSPMQRFAAMTATEDPFPLLAKQAMSEMKVDYGSLESVTMRSEAAVLTTSSVDHKSTREGSVEDPGRAAPRVKRAKRCIRRPRPVITYAMPEQDGQEGVEQYQSAKS